MLSSASCLVTFPHLDPQENGCPFLQLNNWDLSDYAWITDLLYEKWASIFFFNFYFCDHNLGSDSPPEMNGMERIGIEKLWYYVCHPWLLFCCSEMTSLQSEHSHIRLTAHSSYHLKTWSHRQLRHSKHQRQFLWKIFPIILPGFSVASEITICQSCSWLNLIWGRYWSTFPLISWPDFFSP